MAWTLYRYILRELVKWLLLSTAAMVLVISFVLAIKPMMDGLLDVGSLPLFVLFTAPTTLQFVLPFTGAFSATMVFTRMASANEITACSAGGMSYRAILFPVVVLGLVMTMGMYCLSNWLVPWSFRRAAQEVRSDVVRYLQSQVEKGRAVRIPGQERAVLYAERMEVKELPAEVKAGILAQLGASGFDSEPEGFRLTNAAVWFNNLMGEMKQEATASTATGALCRAHGQTLLIVQVKDASLYDPADGTMKQVKEWQPDWIRVRDRLSDRPQALTLGRLREVLADPERFDSVRDLKYRLAAGVAQQEMVLRIFEELRGDRRGPGIARLRSMQGTGVELYAPVVKLKGGEIYLSKDANSPDMVTASVERSSGAGTEKIKYEAEEGVVRVGSDPYSLEPRARIELGRVRVSHIGGEGASAVGTEHLKQEFDATLSEPLVEPLQKKTADGLLGEAERFATQAPMLQLQAYQFTTQLSAVVRKVKGEMHQRSALSVSALLVLLVGAVLSLCLRTRTALVIYLFTFLLASASVLMAVGGRTLAGNVEIRASLGLGALWSGDVVLAVCLVVAYRRMARN